MSQLIQSVYFFGITFNFFFKLFFKRFFGVLTFRACHKIPSLSARLKLFLVLSRLTMVDCCSQIIYFLFDRNFSENWELIPLNKSERSCFLSQVLRFLDSTNILSHLLLSCQTVRIIWFVSLSFHMLNKS